MHTAGSSLPPPQQLALQRFGQSLRTARKLKKHSLSVVSQETQLGVATLRRAEAGDSTVRIGIYVLLAVRYEVPFLEGTLDAR